MTLETFFEKFDQFADAPDAVAKLRELVLDWAVRGKLVVQNVTEESAAQLLKRVLAEKNRRTGSSEHSDEEAGSPQDDEAFEIPGNWEWIGATTPAIMVSDQGKKVQTKYILEAGKYPVVDQGKMFIRGYCDNSDKVISVAEPIVLFGDHTRETKFIDFDFVVGADGVKLLQPICIDPRFYFLALRWLPLESRGYARHFKMLKAARIPLPPLAEQKRIVAKVDELMALCDRLEAQQKERETLHAELARASLALFADAPTSANLPFLFHPSYAIPPADLRKSILTLAPRGQLVEQRKAEGVAEHNSEAAFSPEKLPYELPDGWVWKRLGDLVEFIGGSQPPKAKFIYEPREGYTRFIQIRDFKSDANLTFIPTPLANRPFKEDDVMIGRYGPPVFQILRGLSGTYNVALMKAEPISKLISKDFLFYLLQEPRIQDRVIAESDRTAGQSGVRKPLLLSFIVAIPPLAEQRRIVAKVEQLMALVDELETQLAASRDKGQKLLEAVVGELTLES